MPEERKKVVFVTGASSGIGYALADELAALGHVVYAAARRVAPMEALVEKHGDSLVKVVQLDVTDSDQINAFKERLTSELPDGKLDVLFNNAGQSCVCPAVDVTSERIERCFKVNVFAPMNITRELAPFLIKAKGTIVFIGSIAGAVPFPFGSVYSSTKAAIHQYSHVLHLEMKPLGVKVLNVVTGAVRTDIEDKESLPETSIFNTPEGVKAIEGRRLMARQNEPMDPKVYAKKLINDTFSKSDQRDVYRGRYATIATLASSYLPTWILESYLIKKFGLRPAFDAVKLKHE